MKTCIAVCAVAVSLLAAAPAEAYRCRPATVEGGRITHITTHNNLKCRSARNVARYWWRGGWGEGYLGYGRYRWWGCWHRGGRSWGCSNGNGRRAPWFTFRAPLLD